MERFYDVCLLCWSGSFEFYKKVAEVMQEEKTTLKSLRNPIDDIILDQWVSMHLDHPHNGQYV